MTTCELCWAKFGTEDDLAQHIEMEEAVDWPVDDYVTRLAPRDTWPDLRLTFHLPPWCWRLKPRFYIDDVDGMKGHWSLSWWFFAVEWWGNKRLFTERVGRQAPSTNADTI